MSDPALPTDNPAVWREVLSLIIEAGRFLEVLVDEASVERAMRELLEALPVPPNEDLEDRSWHELWAEFGSEYPWGLYGTVTYLREMNYFAFYGTSLDGILETPGTTFKERAAAIQSMLQTCQAFVERIPAEWDGGDAPAIRTMLLAADARLRLDTGLNVSPELLAALAGVGPKSVRNLMTPKSGVDALRTKDGHVLNEDAVRWLAGRPNFRASSWMEPEPYFGSTPDPIEDLGEVIFVPTARDGGWFDPASCRHRGGFVIGPKNSELVIDDYYQALQRLARMPTPYWRRPNPSGRLTVVVGVSWSRMPVAEVEALLRAGEGS